MAAKQSPSPWQQPIAAGIERDALTALLSEQFGATVDSQATDGWGWIVPAQHAHAALQFLRDDERTRCGMLLELTAVDYLAYPGWRDERFAVVYQLKSLTVNHRIRIKVLLEEDAAEIPTVSDLFKIADWLERETWDQYGIVFTGHPNLKRLLNHHEFDGHPLRKDYPVQKRQHLSVNDPMMDELTGLLERRGYRIVDAEAPVEAAVEGQS